MSTNNQAMPWHGIPRDQIEWHPTVIEARCIGCGLCTTSCGRGVYAFDYERNVAVVVNPIMCMVGCTTCATICARDAIEFPSQGHIRQLIRDKKVLRQSKDMLRTAGFNAAETLLAALGACVLTNVNTIGRKMRLHVNAAQMRFTAIRQDEPPVLTHIGYELILDSPEPPEKLEELYRLAVKWGTVTSTLMQGLTPEGQLTITDTAIGSARQATPVATET